MIIIGANGGVISREDKTDKPNLYNDIVPAQRDIVKIPDIEEIVKPEIPRKRKKKTTKAYILLGLAFFLGMLYGAFLINKYDQQAINALSFITKHFAQNRASQPVYLTFLNSAISGLILLMGMYLSGFSVIGAPISVGLLTFEGLGLGVSLSYLYLYHKMQGVLFSLATIIPGAILMFFVLVVAAYESICMSMGFSKYLRRGMIEQKHNVFWRYTMKYVVFIVAVLVCAVVDCITTFFLAGYFKL